MRNHAQAILACDFFIVVTARFRILYVFVAMEVGTRRIVHFNVTAHPTADWTLQQFRETTMGEPSYRFVLHDRDSIFSTELDSGQMKPNPAMPNVVEISGTSLPQFAHSAIVLFRLTCKKASRGNFPLQWKQLTSRFGPQKIMSSLALHPGQR